MTLKFIANRHVLFLLKMEKELQLPTLFKKF